MDAAMIEAFEANRTRLRRLAYMMLGVVADAEDVLQEAWLRWRRGGGGKRPAALRPLVGPQDIVRTLQGIAWRSAWVHGVTMRAVRINGYPGVVMTQPDGPMTVSFQPSQDGRIAGIFLMRNPDKLGHVD